MMITKDKLKIHIVENNNEVLPIFIRDIGKHLNPGEDIALVRFDAYANFLVPKNVQADDIEKLDHLIDSIDNQSWILPAVYRGYIKNIFWFKPPWGHQFDDGVYQLQVGKCQQTGVLKIASTLPYFTSNCVYSSSDKLSNIHTVDIYVLTCGLAKNYIATNEPTLPPVYDHDSGSESLDSDNRKKVKLANEETNHKDSSTPVLSKRLYPLTATLFNQLLDNKQFLIDVNLAFFSTDDPIRKQFDENEYEILRYVYTRIVQEQTDAEILQYITARESALEQIRTLMNEYLTDPKADQPVAIDNIYLSALITVIRHKKLDWKAIHNYAMRLSDTRPPLHVSSEGMILYLLEAMTKILESIKKEPILITIAKCVNDGYCSLEQADLIQLNVEKRLRKVYTIEDVVGKSLSKSLVNYDDNADETNDDDAMDKKSSVSNNEENNHTKSEDKTVPMETNTNDNNTSKSDTKVSTGAGAGTKNINNQTSPPSPKSNLSPGEIKPVSPSSLSEASPVSN